MSSSSRVFYTGKTMFEKIKNIHFVGIGGSGMSGIAEVLLNLGYKVTGSDIKKSETTEHLRKAGAKILIGHSKKNIKNADVVVISTAIDKKNPEVSESHRLKIPVIPRIEMLAEIARMKYTIAVGGTHGKTTTTSLAALILKEGNLDPTIVVGGRLKNIKSGAKLGGGKFLVAEADESDGSFLKLSPTVSIVTNIDDDHLDYYGTMENLNSAFIEFINKVPFYGCSILCADDRNIRALYPKIKRRFVTYGLSPDADYNIRKIRNSGGLTSFEIFGNNKKLLNIRWGVAGIHNTLNATAAAVCGMELGIDTKKIKNALEGFKGVSRRLEIKHSKGGVVVMDDYGHHPTEIAATIDAIKRHKKPKRLIVIFQPHRFTRTKFLYKKIAKALNRADSVKLMEIYPAGEKQIEGIKSNLIFDELKKLGACVEMFEKNDLKKLSSELKNGDAMLTLGAGDVYRLSDEISKLIVYKK